MGDATTHAHEAAHGWYGNGVRIGCWEDFVLSEGTVSYLAARAIQDVVGSDAGAAVWSGYNSRLNSAMASAGLKVAWPDGCGELDILEDGLFSSVPYMKGAHFYRALERRIGAEAVVEVLATFYQRHVGQGSGMQQLLDTVVEVSGYDAAECADSWLRREDLPASQACP
jgi:aminopeptidase N